MRQEEVDQLQGKALEQFKSGNHYLGKMGFCSHAKAVFGIGT